MSEISDLEANRDGLTIDIDNLTQVRDEVNRNIRRLKAEAFIAVNQIKKADVELSSGDDKPWFGHAQQFIDWMKAQGCTKRWAEWNDHIFFTSDLLAGHMKGTPVWIDDIKD